MANMETETCRMVAGFMVLHGRKFQADHEAAFRRINELFPELKTHKLVASSDGEFTKLLGSTFTMPFIANSEIHILKYIARWVEKHGGTKADVEFYRKEHRDLLLVQEIQKYISDLLN